MSKPRPVKRPRKSSSPPSSSTSLYNNNNQISNSSSSVSAYQSQHDQQHNQHHNNNNNNGTFAKPTSPSKLLQASSSSSSSSSNHSSSSSSSVSSSKKILNNPSSVSRPSMDINGNPISYAVDDSVYSELALLRQENEKLKTKLNKLAPKKKRLDTSLHSISDASNRVQKRTLARQTSVATDAALNEIAMSAERNVTTNLLAEHIIDRCSGTVAHKDFESIMRRPNFVREFMSMCDETKNILSKEKRVLDINSPCYVLGDIHGNLDDLRFFSQRLWTLGMHLTGSNFLFMGDYVDRGMYGIEVIMYLFAYKIKVPHKVFLLRGNHETRSVNGWVAWYKQRCFLHQCRVRFGRYGDSIWEKVNQVFDCLPFAATIDESIFCVHGGIPPRETSLPGNRIQQMLQIPVPVKIPFPSEHLSGAIDSEAEHDEDDEGEDVDVDIELKSSNADISGILQVVNEEEEYVELESENESEDIQMTDRKNESSSSSVSSSSQSSVVPVTQPQDDSQESQDNDDRNDGQNELPVSDEEEESSEDHYHSVASQATQVGDSQRSQVSDYDDDDDDGDDNNADANGKVEDDPNESEESKMERKKELQLHRTRLYQRLAFNLIWADPADTKQEIALQHNKNSTESSGEDVGRRLQNGFGKGHRGDDSVIYGWNAINEFLQETGCELIMRAHEATAGGVKICKHAKVITVFSTSKDHGVRKGNASCACVLVDRHNICVINKSPLYDEMYLSVE